MSEFNAPKRAAIYTRISSDRSGEGLGVERQREDCERLAKRAGHVVGDRFYEDNDKSAYSGKRRPAYEQMLADIKAGLIDVVVAWHTDRLHRRPTELERYINVCKRRKVATLTVQSGKIDLATYDGQMTARIVGAVAANESDKKSARIRRKHEQLAMSGAWGGGARVFGYRRSKTVTEVPNGSGAVDRSVLIKVAIEPDEADILRACVRRLLAGESLKSLVVDLIAAEVPTVRGGTWTESTLRSVMAAARNSGQREWTPIRSETDEQDEDDEDEPPKRNKSNGFGPIVAAGNWPAIITPEQTAAVRALLSDPARKTTRPGRHMLSGGLIVCVGCGKSLNSRWTHGVRSYACLYNEPKGKCGKMSIVADKTDAILVGLVLEALVNRTTGETSSTRPRAAAIARQQELRDAEEALRDLAAIYGDRSNRMTTEQFMAARVPLMATIDRLAEFAESRGANALAKLPRTRAEIQAWWDTAGLSRRQAILKALIERIEVQPVRRRGYSKYDPDRLRIVWRA